MWKLSRALWVLLFLFPFLSYGQQQIIIDPNQNEKDIQPFIIDSFIPTTTKVPLDNSDSSIRSSDRTLNITNQDILWDFQPGGEFVDVIIRKKAGIESVLLTNMYFGEPFTTSYGNKVYGLRSRAYNAVNGEEVRMVKNQVIGKKQGLLFLTDSTPETHRVFGKAFRIRIPQTVEYGYKEETENYGLIRIEKGVTLNLRTYQRKYADHRGSFQNNPIQIDFDKVEYNEQLKPQVTKQGMYRKENKYVLVVDYSSRLDYVKYFLLRDIYQNKNFQRIAFLIRGQEILPYVKVMRATQKAGEGINITAEVHIPIDVSEKDYDISAVDQSNRIAKNFVSYTVPGKSTTRKTPSNTPPLTQGEVILYKDPIQPSSEQFFEE